MRPAAIRTNPTIRICATALALATVATPAYAESARMLRIEVDGAGG